MNPTFILLLSAIFLVLLLVWWNQDRLIFFPEKLPKNFVFR
ncbi:hypothetical protein LEP1GSC043_0953, partial [Leptospira weilii str. Ecochallenge]